MSSNGVTEDDDFGDDPFRKYNENVMLDGDNITLLG